MAEAGEAEAKRKQKQPERVICKLVTVAEKPLQLKDEVVEYLEKYYGKDGVERLRASLSRPPSITTLRVNTNVIERDELIKKLKAELGDKKATSGEKWADLIRPHPQLPDVVTLPVVGPAAIAPVEKEVVVGRKCGEAMMRGASAYVPGIAGGSRDVKEGDIVSVIVDSNDAILKAGITNVCKHGGMEAKYMKGSGGKAPKVREGESAGKKNKHRAGVPEFAFVGLGIAKMSRAEIVKAEKGVAVELTAPLFDAPSLNNVLPGLFYLQNLPSSVAAHNLNPLPGEVVLDMCAAPGGKTTHIATLMGNKGVVHACDRSSVKAKKIEEAARHLSLTIVHAHKMDSTKSAMPVELSSSASPLPPPAEWPISTPKGKFFPRESFDRILLDPPCSGLGLRPKLEELATVRELTEHSLYQRLIFENAMALLKPGGEMVYSTCTINPGENEEMVAWALKHFPLEVLPAREGYRVGGEGVAGTGLNEADREKVQLFNPADTPSCIGFFVTRLRKTASIDKVE